MQPEFQSQFDKAINNYAGANMFQPSMIPAHVHNGTDSLLVDYFNLQNKIQYILNRIVAPTTNTAVATTVGGDYVMPYNGYVTVVGATVDTKGTTNVTTINIKKNGTSILKTKITIDSDEKTSRTAATPPIIDVSKQNFVVGDVFTFDVDTISTTPAKGLTIFMNVIMTA